MLSPVFGTFTYTKKMIHSLSKTQISLGILYSSFCNSGLRGLPRFLSFHQQFKGPFRSWAHDSA